MEINREEIAGYRIGGKLICAECFSEEENEAVTSDMILSFDELEEDEIDYFCYKCNKQLER